MQRQLLHESNPTTSLLDDGLPINRAALGTEPVLETQWSQLAAVGGVVHNLSLSLLDGALLHHALQGVLDLTRGVLAHQYIRLEIEHPGVRAGLQAFPEPFQDISWHQSS